jgi:hypothetical protein
VRRKEMMVSLYCNNRHKGAKRSSNQAPFGKISKGRDGGGSEGIC